jgi:hypothetical protein
LAFVHCHLASGVNVVCVTKLLTAHAEVWTVSS